MTSFQYVCRLHDNAPAHISEIVKQFLKILPHPPTKLKMYDLVGEIPPDKPFAQPSASYSQMYTQISRDCGHLLGKD